MFSKQRRGCSQTFGIQPLHSSPEKNRICIFRKKSAWLWNPVSNPSSADMLQNAAARNALQEAAQLPVSVAFFSSTLKFKPIFFSRPNRAEPSTNCLRPDGSFAATFSIPAAAGDVPLPQIEPESFAPSAVRQRKPQNMIP
ncbi:hypothetical protein ABEV38_16970 [Parageobacillus thermoglucosidasius]|uniref:hypothetical protein n=1 Tax=Parageobacillus thermoglucosidasius TaxID=1426 RepID=UPI003D2C5C14